MLELQFLTSVPGLTPSCMGPLWNEYSLGEKHGNQAEFPWGKSQERAAGNLRGCTQYRSTWDSREIQPLTGTCWIPFCERVEERPGLSHQCCIIKKKSIKPFKREKQEQGVWSDILQLCWQQGRWCRCAVSRSWWSQSSVRAMIAAQQGLASTRAMSAAGPLYGHLEQPWNASRALWRFLHSGSSWVATQWNPLMAGCTIGPGSPFLLSKESSFARGRLWTGKDWQSGCSFIPGHYTYTEKICWPTVIAYQWLIEIRSNDYVCVQTQVHLTTSEQQNAARWWVSHYFWSIHFAIIAFFLL